MPENDQKALKGKNSCNLCKVNFTIINHKVSDHNHPSGKYRQPLRNTCNLKLQLPNFVSCFIHNLSNYDAHFIVRELGFDINKITIITNSDEKLISFLKYVNNDFSIRFIDTYRFMASSLSILASNLIIPELIHFRETSKVFSIED